MFVNAKMYFRSIEMKWIPKYLLICLFISGLTRLNAQQISVKGYVLSIDSNQLVPLANILNQKTQQRFIGSRQGLFKALVSPTDSIMITAIGYESLFFQASDIIPENANDTVKLYMRPTSYQLKDVTFIYSNRARDSIAMVAAEFLKSDPLLNNYDRVLNRNKGGLMSPLTAMYMEYSKAGQDMKKFEEFVQHAEMLKQVNTRYNHKTIKRATGLEEEYIDEYILFCKLDRSFILNSSDYDLILAMRQCATRFKAEKGLD
jgi:hypothetical protein